MSMLHSLCNFIAGQPSAHLDELRAVLELARGDKFDRICDECGCRKGDHSGWSPQISPRRCYGPCCLDCPGWTPEPDPTLDLIDQALVAIEHVEHRRSR